MNKTFSKIEISQFKRIAQNVYPYVKKVQKLGEKIEALQEEINGYMDIIDSQENIVRKITGGYTTADIIERTVNENGQAQFNLKYPDTITPPCEGVRVCEEKVVAPQNAEISGDSMSND